MFFADFIGRQFPNPKKVLEFINTFMKTKICSRCKKEKPYSEFNKNKNKPDGYQYICRECHSKNNKKHYQNNKQQYIENSKQRKIDHKKWLNEYKESKFCEKCGEKRWYVLEFHHKEPSEKEWNIARMVADGFGIERIQEEINKCVVLCANCHRELHYLERI